MNLLILSGTPKKDGLCHSLAAAALDAAETAGAEAEVIRLNKISACRMCGDGWGDCSKIHQCKFGETDDFSKFQEKIRWADGFVLITPVYWGEMSEGMKSFFDRLRRCEASKSWNENEKGPSYFSGKSSILVASAGGGGGGITTAFQQMERAVSHMGGTSYPYDVYGFFDYIAVNRWNSEYKIETLKSAVSALVKK